MIRSAVMGWPAINQWLKDNAHADVEHYAVRYLPRHLLMACGKRILPWKAAEHRLGARRCEVCLAKQRRPRRP